MFKAIQKIKVREDRGFTLVELLIVVAIIGILAAIAIPQFSAYRIRGYNTAAASDLRNLKLAEEAFRTDWQVYVSTAGCNPTTYAGCTGAAGAGVDVDGPGNVAMSIAALTIVSPYPSAATSFAFGLSSGVTSGISTTATAANYTAYTAHTQGDVIYGADSDLTQIKMAGKTDAGAATTLTLKTSGTKLADVPASTTGDDLLPTASWVNL